MKATTIDNLNIADHVRWAQDQVLLDTSHAIDASIVAPHPEILGTSSIYTSKWDELVEWQKRNIPWAGFVQPPFFHLASRRLFSYRIFPSIHWVSDEESDDHSEEDQSSPDLIKKVLSQQKFPHRPAALFERDKTYILNLLGSIQSLNELSAMITSRKLQYQKG